MTVQGVVDNEDVDYYAIEAKKGQRITAEVEGMRLGTTLFDPYVAILDAKRFELAASDDASSASISSCVSILLTRVPPPCRATGAAASAAARSPATATG